jgi:hypothetical protein
MAVITLAEYKTLAGISGTTQDALITALIPLVEDDIVAICNYAFGQGTVDEDFPDGMKLYATQMITFQIANAGKVATMQSESIDGYSYTRADVGASGYPATIESGIASKWRRASFKSTQAVSAFRDRRGQGVQAITERGPSYSYPGIPLDE